MLAGLTRIIEVCYFVPSYVALDPIGDDTSEGTLTDDNPISRNASSSRAAGANAWQHLPPFVSIISFFTSHLYLLQLLVASG